eukprot:COSAG02_NODE_1557_length_11939_cov_343.602872_2_plen_88_part_00
MNRHCIRDLSSMPPLCAGMPLTTTQYALNIKRRKNLKSVTHKAYGRRMPYSDFSPKRPFLAFGPEFPLDQVLCSHCKIVVNSDTDFE